MSVEKEYSGKTILNLDDPGMKFNTKCSYPGRHESSVQREVDEGRAIERYIFLHEVFSTPSTVNSI
jgi:hypothetical protein